MTRPAIYLDHNASAPLLPEARAALMSALELAGSPSSVHGHGRALRNIIENGRDQVARLTGADRQQVVFTGSATEAITQAILGGMRAFGVDGIIITAGEHSAVSKAAEMAGVPVTVIGLNSAGQIRVEEIAVRLAQANAAGQRLLVAVHAVNNETGVVQPLGRIEALVGPSPHYLFVDAVQACGKLPLEFASRPTDMMAVSAHKIGGPVGVGALLVKSHADSVRLIPGGGQEQGRRGGTESAALIAGFGAAAEAFPQRYDGSAVAAQMSNLEAGVRSIDAGVVVFGRAAERLGNCSNFASPGLKASVAMMGLDLMGLSVSSGSACSSGKVGPSHVLAAMGVSPELAECALRVSLGWSSTQEDVAAFLSGFAEVLGRHHRRQGRAA
ncbi:MAG TPA: aminotransferase class V-fold PLP-dependent enzyme [Devosiaceae bacterium]|nr:aminotransferase class V-fold PLP-dependent enzyme [Devosiaceae bacterium]